MDLGAVGELITAIIRKAADMHCTRAEVVQACRGVEAAMLACWPGEPERVVDEQEHG